MTQMFLLLQRRLGVSDAARLYRALYEIAEEMTEECAEHTRLRSDVVDWTLWSAPCQCWDQGPYRCRHADHARALPAHIARTLQSRTPLPRDIARIVVAYIPGKCVHEAREHPARSWVCDDCNRSVGWMLGDS